MGSDFIKNQKIPKLAKMPKNIKNFLCPVLRKTHTFPKILPEKTKKLSKTPTRQQDKI